MTPDSLTGTERLSYRWARGQVRVDIAVPPRANEQNQPPQSVTAARAVEVPATQQALRPTERVQVLMTGGPVGWVRRPELLGALVVKSAAALHDRRDTDRHREDLVALCEAMAVSGELVEYRDQLRAKDHDRLTRAADTVRPAQWRLAQDPDAAQDALRFLLDHDD